MVLHVFLFSGCLKCYFETFAEASKTKSMTSMERGRLVRLFDWIEFLFHAVSKCGRAIRAP